MLVVVTFCLAACAQNAAYQTGSTGLQGASGGHGAHSNDPIGKSCHIDIECGVGYSCSAGRCVGGIAPAIKGDCIRGDFGKKVCSNTGKPCHVDSECFK
jgi:hypothetical protein